MYNMSFTPNHTADLVSRYMILTKEIMPQMVRNREVKWPVQNDHCFQRIVLDAICNGHWHKYLARPAYKHLTTVRLFGLCSCARILSLAVSICMTSIGSHLFGVGNGYRK